MARLSAPGKSRPVSVYNASALGQEQDDRDSGLPSSESEQSSYDDDGRNEQALVKWRQRSQMNDATIASLDSSASGRDAPLTPTRIRSPRRGTPSKVKHATPRGTQRRIQESETRGRDLPLVLLNISFMPLPEELMGKVLLESGEPELAKQSLELETRLTSGILRRGILIKHPRDDFALLHERLLQALGLTRTNDGPQLCTRSGLASHGSDSDLADETKRRDSATDLHELHSAEQPRRCSTCDLPIRPTLDTVGVEQRGWTIQVFAGNGLIQESSWSVAWREMERVDVLITPTIDDETRTRRLARRETANPLSPQEPPPPAASITIQHPVEPTGIDPPNHETSLPLLLLERDRRDQWVVERLTLLEAQMTDLRRATVAPPRPTCPTGSRLDPPASSPSSPSSSSPPPPPRSSSPPQLSAHRQRSPTTSATRPPPPPQQQQQQIHLPPAFQPRDVPLDLLLRNYLALLLRDPKNLIILALALLVVVLGVQVQLAGPGTVTVRSSSSSAAAEAAAAVGGFGGRGAVGSGGGGLCFDAVGGRGFEEEVRAAAVATGPGERRGFHDHAGRAHVAEGLRGRGWYEKDLPGLRTVAQSMESTCGVHDMGRKKAHSL